jgi:hypothetical protein
MQYGALFGSANKLHDAIANRTELHHGTWIIQTDTTAITNEIPSIILHKAIEIRSLVSETKRPVWHSTDTNEQLPHYVAGHKQYVINSKRISKVANRS